MVTKNQAIEIVKNYILESKDDDKVDKCKDMLAKLNSISEEEFNKIVCRTFEENSGMNEFNSWLTLKLQERDLQGTEFIQLNEFVSYNIAGISKDTLALHLVPTHVTTQQIRNSGSYLAEALEQLRSKIKEGEFANIECILAVSDILKLKVLQRYFKDLGFDVREGEEMFRRRFKNPYQASLDKDTLVSDEWEELKKQFMEGRPTVDELHDKNKDDIGENEI